MSHSADFSTFRKNYEDGKPQVVWSKLIADLETPVSAMLKMSGGRPNSFLLESVVGGDKRNRYSFIGLKPDLIWRCVGKTAEINRNARFDPDAFEPCPISAESGPLVSLRALVQESKIDLPPELPPMAAGLVGYMSYDMVRQAEKLPDNNPDTIGVPDGVFVRPTVMAVFDNVDDSVMIVTPVRPRAGVDAKAAFDMAQERISDVISDSERPLPHQKDRQAISEFPEPTSNMTRDEFRVMVEKAKEYILAGDIFQVVLSQRLYMPFKLPPFSLYRALRRTNPSPYMFFLDFGGYSIVGSSPEVLVRLRDGKVTIRPIAGTRKRGANALEDMALAEELRGDEKELAEHLMLLDLGRNDVGRVAKVGSVKVTEKMVVEYYSHVMHLVSNVEGDLDSSKFDAMDSLFAGFPAGTVSGAPKVRAMEIIDELEPVRRSFYAGCIGYFSANGDLDTCIALRTALVKDETIIVQAGGGVVADSSPEGEYQESWNKARAVIKAAEEAVRFSSLGRGN